MDLSKKLALSKNLAILAGKEILKIYQSDVTVNYKKDQSPVTNADILANQIIVDGLIKNFSDHAILSEEQLDNRSRLMNEWCWLIDPIDGTKEFINKDNDFTINIGLAYKKRIVLGVIYVPVTGELFYASKDNGAYLEKNGQTIKLSVSPRINELTILKSRYNPSEKVEQLIRDHHHRIKSSKIIGSSLKSCRIAQGDAEIYYRFGPTNEWDIAASQCIVEEAGGIIRLLDDSPILYNQENPMITKGYYIINRTENKFYTPQGLG